MIDLPLAIKQAIRTDKPIEMDGYTFYPILVEEIDELEYVRPAIEFMQQNFPVKYAAMPLLSAFFAYDYDRMREHLPPTGLFARATYFLALCLRLGCGRGREARTDCFRVAVDMHDPSRLKSVQADMGEEILNITPVMFSRWRAVLAAQNALEIPDESKNIELLEAKHDILSSKDIALKRDIDDLISAVALVSQCDEVEVMKWSVRKFYQRKRSVERLLNFVICGIGEAQGTKWKGGNPCPSWCYERERDNPALVPMSSFMQGAGAAAVERTGGAPVIPSPAD